MPYIQLILLCLLLSCRPQRNPINAGGFTWPPAAELIDSVDNVIIFCPPGKDSTPIVQTVFAGAGSWHLVTSNGALYDNVIHGTEAFVRSQLHVEYSKALQRRRPVATIKIKCD